MEALIQAAQSLLGLKLTPRQMATFRLYEHELLEWNTRFNLTAIRDIEGIRTKHFLDSLTCLLAMRAAPPIRLVDIGTGAGFPGIPLKIIYPTMQLTLVESVGKKADFCRHIAEILKLDKVIVLSIRAEDLGQDPRHRERYDWAVARAVANLPVLAEFLLPLVSKGGAMLAQKGQSGPAEAQSAEKAIRILGGHLRKLIPVQLPGVADDRWLVVADKIAPTPPQYPRPVGTPAKNPL